MTDHAVAPAGLLLVDKPAGPTSHRVVAQVRRLAGTRKVGHAGTLDPMATGLLVLGVGAGTRLLHYLVGADKTYRATVRFGITTDTEDAEGEPTSQPGCSQFSTEILEQAADQFRGPILQVPSSVSAIKVDGKRAYARVRAGETVELKERPVTIHSLEILPSPEPTTALVQGWEVPVVDVSIQVSCSSGTYIRALARDLGNALGCGAHLTALRRTGVGQWDVRQAARLDTLVAGDLPIIPLGQASREMLGAITVSSQAAAKFRHGRAPLPPEIVSQSSGRDGGPVWTVFGEDSPERALGLVQIGSAADGSRTIATKLVFSPA